MNRFGYKTTAILPTGTSLNPAHPEKNMFHQDWRAWDEPRGADGTYLLLRSDRSWDNKCRYIILSGSGSPENYPVEDFRFCAHHDQTHADLGGWTVVKKVTHSEIGQLRAAMLKPSAPLYVYK